MPIRHAACSCGRLRAEVTGEPVRISICHCFECQRRTGSAFGAQARFAEENVRITGDATEYRRSSDSGKQVSFRFCPRCGSTVYYTLEAVPGFIAIPVGMFADPAFPPPRVSIFEARKHPWIAITATIEHLD